LEQIRQVNKQQLDDVGGPNQSIDMKLDQIDMLIAIEEAAEKGNIPQLLLTHYTHNMRHALK
jgi:hypothetical protein